MKGLRQWMGQNLVYCQLRPQMVAATIARYLFFFNIHLVFWRSNPDPPWIYNADSL